MTGSAAIVAPLEFDRRVSHIHGGNRVHHGAEELDNAVVHFAADLGAAHGGIAVAAGLGVQLVQVNGIPIGKLRNSRAAPFTLNPP